MKQRQIFFSLVALFFVRNASGNPPRVVDLKTPDGTILKGIYFVAAKLGPVCCFSIKAIEPGSLPADFLTEQFHARAREEKSLWPHAAKAE